MATIVLATRDGTLTASSNGSGWEAGERGLAGQEVTSVAACDGSVLAGTRQGVFRSNGNGFQPDAEGLSIPYVRWMAFDAEGEAFAGTEPAGIFHLDGGEWQGSPEVESLRDRFKWFLPYSPEAGCVRGFAFHGDRVYAAVEVGGVLRSDDRGRTWRLAGGSDGRPKFGPPAPEHVHPDVHSVGVHPSSPDLVFAATGGGFYGSKDGGGTWEALHQGSYCRAFWLDPDDPRHIVLGPADDVSQNGRIEESRDGGKSWVMASEGLDLPWPDRMVERFVPVCDELFAVTNDERLFVSPQGRLEWRQVLPEVPGIRGVAALEV